MTEHHIIRPEPHIFEDYTDEKFEQTVVVEKGSTAVKKAVSSQGTLVYITQGVRYPENGILMDYSGVPYARQGFVFPEALDCINSFKRVNVLFLAVLKGKGIKGRIGTFLYHYCWLADWMFQFYEPNSNKIRRIYLKPNRYRQSVRELIKLINLFIANLGIKVRTLETGDAEKDFGKTVGTMIEYDNAYYWRMEDIFSETTKERLLRNPRKELKRLLQIYKQREKMGIDFKAETVIKVLNYLLLIPSIKKAFRKAIENVEVKNLGMTKDDSYFTMNYGGYDFQGKSTEERQKIWLEMTNGIAPQRMFIPQQ